jgi:hypothetical protein
MSSPIFRWSVPLAITALILNHSAGTPPRFSGTPAGLGVAYFEPPRSIGTPLDDVVRVYSGFGLAARIEGRLRLDTDATLTAQARELIRRRLAQGS